MYDAAILGGGLAGGCMAYVLAGMGWRTVIIDQKTFPRHKVCGEFLSPESAEILAAFGLDQMLNGLGPASMESVRLFSVSGVSLDIPLPGPAIGISRYALDYALHQAVCDRGGEVRTGVTVASATREERGYRLETMDKPGPRVIEARAVIAAWGRNPRAGLAGFAKQSPRRMDIGVKTHMEGIDLEPAAELYFFPGGYLGLSPIEKGRCNIAALLSRTAFHHAGKSLEGVLKEAARANPALHRRLAGGKPVPGTQAAVAPVPTRRMPSAWEDGIPRIGDAAAVIPPLCGDGMAMALRSVELCAPLADGFLRGKLSLEAWRRQYTDALCRELAGPIRWGSLLQALLRQPQLASPLFRLGSLSPLLARRLVQATRLKKRL